MSLLLQTEAYHTISKAQSSVTYSCKWLMTPSLPIRPKPLLLQAMTFEAGRRGIKFKFNWQTHRSTVGWHRL